MPGELYGLITQLPPDSCYFFPLGPIFSSVNQSWLTSVTGLPSVPQTSRTYYVQSQYTRSLTMTCFGDMAPSSGPNIHHTFEKEIYGVPKKVINL